MAESSPGPEAVVKRHIRELVDEAIRYGSLFAAGRGKTVTIGNRRRPTIRVQAAIFTVLTGGYLHPRDQWLEPWIKGELVRRR